MISYIDHSTATGGWLASVVDKAMVYAHAAIGSTGDDPVTIYWGGGASAQQVRDFFENSVNGASQIVDRPPYFRTVLIVSDKETAHDDEQKLAIHNYASATFVRFERLIDKPAPYSENAEPAEADYIVWARVGVTDPTVTDSIGVYLHPSALLRISGVLAPFVSKTILSPMGLPQAESSLAEIRDILPKLLQ